jgi:N-acetylgalactosamine-N,N'-diacetylbacillosaminyl-diphospho-undecaprenol 4-alpha-N-acetylgalactosaminyltransferase
LSARVCELGLEHKVRFLGYAVNPFAIVRRADMFISPSHCEGFPNAIAEAMALGVPVVSTDCPSGPAELLDEVESTGAGDVHAGRYGLLVPVARPDLLAKGMKQMSEPETRRRYSAAARLRIEDFRIDKVSDQYWTTFAKVLEESRNVTGQKRLRRARQSADAFPADEGHAGR